ncbi:hypothetical protein DSL64_19940 [Dyadobacter luteus]|uniref:Uncharacterized protein n=1 Tax=Dyadobacter luteus TaxID=2259619 RepID=A0A3D8Y6W5_9BACT|nr:hypothetical protein DSL64_19940 [Dyadobacter luteus]
MVRRNNCAPITRAYQHCLHTSKIYQKGLVPRLKACN